MVWVWVVLDLFGMAWGGTAYVTFFVLRMTISLLSGHAATERILGRKNIFRYKISLILFGLALAFVTQLFGKYSWISFCILCAVSISSWLISSLFRKQKSGRLLIDVGRTPQNKVMFWIGWYSVIVAVIQIWFVFNLAVVVKHSSASLDLELARLIFTLSSVSFFIALGLNRLEFRENGFCFMYSFVKWQKVNSYTWGPVNPNELMIRFKSKFPLLPGLMIVDIPEEHKDMVRYVLDDKLPDKNL